MAIDRDAARAELETGITDQKWAVGRVLCPAGERCTSGPLNVFRPLRDGRVPMHRGFLGAACTGAHQKPTTPPLRLRTADTTQES
ncbi:hypothetical protein [Streptomyces xanthophaeus]|uniref:hypothetical protein n=1 Tax=Streptomyces xanthophaeus TaxID=67385 RepID=UPI00264773DF|nr:hypothetical protein [Streptomyces xanthophaeus]WKD36544.1 hypothetical protein KO717_34495 [Streptomyces xanthophaeus]